jgi:hypothetical protein
VQIATSQHSMVPLTALVPDGQTVLIPTTMSAPNLPDGVVVILVRPSIVK